MAPKGPTTVPNGSVWSVEGDGLSVEARIAALAGRQHGLVTRAQLMMAGLGYDAVKYRVRTKRLLPVQRGVYRLGPLVSPRVREMAAVLASGPGAVISHRSRAALLGLLPPPGDSPAVDVTVPRSCRRCRPGIRLHRSGGLEPDEVTTLEGIPVTTPGRTLLDIARTVSTRELEQALARAERSGLATGEDVMSLIRRRPRRPGARHLLGMLRETAGPPLTRSEAEERFLALVRKARLPLSDVNVAIGGFEVDFLWRRERLVVEVDGFAFHSTFDQFERDRNRDAQLSAKGLRVVRVTWHQTVSEPEAMLVRLGQTLACHPAGV